MEFEGYSLKIAKGPRGTTLMIWALGLINVVNLALVARFFNFPSMTQPRGAYEFERASTMRRRWLANISISPASEESSI